MRGGGQCNDPRNGGGGVGFTFYLSPNATVNAILITYLDLNRRDKTENKYIKIKNNRRKFTSVLSKILHRFEICAM
jgi:hypothetical protein